MTHTTESQTTIEPSEGEDLREQAPAEVHSRFSTIRFVQDMELIGFRGESFYGLTSARGFTLTSSRHGVVCSHEQLEHDLLIPWGMIQRCDVLVGDPSVTTEVGEALTTQRHERTLGRAPGDGTECSPA